MGAHIGDSGSNRMVGILSYNLYSLHFNYGAVLHTYAFQQYLKSIGISSEVLDYLPKGLENHCFRFPLFQRPWPKSLRGLIKRFLNCGLGMFANLRKYQKFRRFFVRNYCVSNEAFTYQRLMRADCAWREIDTYVFESDVIWKLENGMDDVFFGGFPACRHTKKVAYAPSMGAKPLHEFGEFGLKALKLIERFDHVSSRDRNGADYLSKRLGRSVAWVLDPVMLLPASHYEKMALMPKYTKYLLIYNCMVDDFRMIKCARRYAQARGLSVIEVSNFYSNRFRFGHKVIADAGIEEWLGLLINASVVFCNSYHGMLFSVLFKKEFYCFERFKNDFRMQSFLKSVEAEDRLVDPGSEIELSEKKLEWDTIGRLVEEQRERSINFIKQSL